MQSAPQDPPELSVLSTQRIEHLFRSIDRENRGFIDHQTIADRLFGSAPSAASTQYSPADGDGAGSESITTTTTTTMDKQSQASKLKNDKENEEELVNFRQHYAQELINQCDGSQSGRITYPEFEAFIRNKERELWYLFRGMNQRTRHLSSQDYHSQKGDSEDVDDELTVDDVRQALMRAGLQVSEAELQAFIKHIDIDNDGLISFEDWSDFFMFLPHETTLHNAYRYFQQVVQSNDAGDPIVLPLEASSANPSKQRLTLKYLLAGSIAGALSRTATAPLDRLRVLLQLVTSANQSPAAATAASPVTPSKTTEQQQSAFRRLHAYFRRHILQTRLVINHIYNDGGLLSFWRGNGINIIKIIPESGVRFYVYETAKRKLISSQHHHYKRSASADGKTKPGLHLQVPEIGMADRMIAGGLAGFVSQSVIYPLETIKIRMMAELSSSFAGNVRRPGTVSAVVVASQMWRAEGFRSFFRGIGPSLIGIVPYASIDLTAYETLKNKLKPMVERGDVTPAMLHLLCGASAGTLSATAVYPLGLIRTRLQAQGTSAHTASYPRGVIDVVSSTYRQESIKGFYKGLIPTLIKVVPAVSLSYFCYEKAKLAMGLT